jgi:hypothetical protein
MRSRTSLALAGALLMTLLPGAASAAQADPAATTVAEELVDVAEGTLQQTVDTAGHDVEGITDLGDLGDVTVDGGTADDDLEVDPGNDETTIDGAPMGLVVDQNGEVLGFPYTL